MKNDFTLKYQLIIYLAYVKYNTLNNAPQTMLLLRHNISFKKKKKDINSSRLKSGATGSCLAKPIEMPS